MSASPSSVTSPSPPLVAVVTGGAQGIGRAVVEMLLTRGIAVAAADLTTAPMEPLLAEHGEEQLSLYTMDVAKEASVDKAAREVLERWGRVDLLVNCAGIFKQTPLLTLDEGVMQRILEVNLCGTLRCMSRFGSIMARGGGGRIINLSSTSGQTGAALAAVYAASKAGVIAATRSAARELADQGIIVVALAPGLCDTPMLAPQRALADRFIVPKIPLKRVATPREVAEMVLFFATCESTYFTGAVITMDGGLNVG